MKKIKFSAAVLMLLMFTVGCAKDDVPTISDHEFAPIVEEKFVFSNVAVDKEKDMIDAFAVMDDNKTALILVNLDNNSRSFAVYEDGEPVSATDISEPYQEICYNAAENCFYTYNAQKKQLCIMDEKFEYRDVLADNFTAFEIKNMDIVDNKLYLITVSKDPFSLEDQDNALDPETGYLDFGERAYSIDLSTKEVDELDIKNVICQSYSNGTLFYYTCRDGHYSLDIYDTDTDSLKAVKNMDETGYIYSFAVIGEKMMYIDPDYDKLIKMDLNSGAKTYEPGRVYIVRNSDFEVYKGSLICLNRDSMSVMRCGGNIGTAHGSEKLSEFSGESIVLGGFDSRNLTIKTSDITAECGISASVYEYPPNDEEIKLKLLAGDSDVDIYTFGSVRRTGIDIRRMGCYVPLTDEAIINKRGSYFDWLADFTENDNGDIWCMPIGTSSYATFYVPENLDALGIKPESLTTFDGYFSALETVKEQNELIFYGRTLDFADMMEWTYNINYSYLDYNNELYRNMFERLYNDWVIWSNPMEGKAEHPLFNNIAISEDFNKTPSHEKMAFTIIHTSNVSSDLNSPDNWRAMALPALSSPDEKTPVTVEYAVINPFSEKKEAAEAYLAFIADNDMKYLRNKSFFYKDKKLCAELADTTGACFDGLFELFENGAVYERQLSIAEGYKDDIIAYQTGETTLDEYIAKLERVAEMTANE